MASGVHTKNPESARELERDTVPQAHVRADRVQKKKNRAIRGALYAPIQPRAL